MAGDLGVTERAVPEGGDDLRAVLDELAHPVVLGGGRPVGHIRALPATE